MGDKNNVIDEWMLVENVLLQCQKNQREGVHTTEQRHRVINVLKEATREDCHQYIDNISELFDVLDVIYREEVGARKLTELTCREWATWEWVDVTVSGEIERSFIKGKIRTPDAVAQAQSDWIVARFYYRKVVDDVKFPAISAEDIKKRIAEIQSESSDPYLVWPFHQAPQVYKDLSPHGGDEGWVAFVPDGQHDKNPPWVWGGFGRSEFSEHDVDGGIILIGAHA